MYARSVGVFEGRAEAQAIVYEPDQLRTLMQSCGRQYEPVLVGDL